MRFNNKITRLAVAGTLAAAIVAITGCRSEEQGRILHYKKGTYLGKPDQKLSDAQERELRSRARNQAF